MFKCLINSVKMQPAKGFKVTDADRKTRVGIAVKTIDDLKKKTIEKFKLKLSSNQIDFQTPDGTFVENEAYFQTLPSQSLLIWVRQGEKAPTDAEILYKMIREVNEEYLSAGEKVQEFFTEKMKNKVFKLAEVLKGIDGSKAQLSTRAEHPEWFQGLDTNAKTKEDYMFRRAQDRIRSYYYKSKEELVKQIDVPQATLQNLLNELHNRLKLSQFHGHLFNRLNATAASPSGKANNLKQALCNPDGQFKCQGRWDKATCLYNPVHSINPYTSREERIIFQTWNLDHVRERTRTVIPAICQALRDSTKTIDRELHFKRIYNDLFTTNNLKLVHIVCHDKGKHFTENDESYLI